MGTIALFAQQAYVAHIETSADGLARSVILSGALLSFIQSGSIVVQLVVGRLLYTCEERVSHGYGNREMV